jgi:hypothetical protein
VKVANFQSRNFGAAESDLQTYRENGAVAQIGNRANRRRVDIAISSTGFQHVINRIALNRFAVIL